MRPLFAPAILAALLASSAALAAPSLCTADSQNLVVNCGFETGDTTGWTFSGAAPVMAQTNLYGIDPYDPNSGNYDVYFATQGGTLGTHTGADSLELSQSITLEINRAYTISFYVAQDSPVGTGYTDYFQATINGVALLTLSNIGSTNGYELETFTYVDTTSSPSTLAFFSQNDAGTWFLDDVFVDQIPEPAAVATFGVGLLGLACMRRARNAKV
jgi:hypothetical protein